MNGNRALQGSRVRVASTRPNPCRPEHRRAEQQEHEAPREVHVDAERRPLDGGVARQAVARQQDAEQSEERSDREAKIQGHGRLPVIRHLHARNNSPRRRIIKNRVASPISWEGYSRRQFD